MISYKGSLLSEPSENLVGLTVSLKPIDSDCHVNRRQKTTVPTLAFVITRLCCNNNTAICWYLLSY